MTKKSSTNLHKILATQDLVKKQQALLNQMGGISKSSEEYKKLLAFNLPTTSYFQKFAAIENSLFPELKLLLEQTRIQKTLTQFELPTKQIQALIKDLKSPWINVNDKTSSLLAVSELHGMGTLLKARATFDNKVTQVIRQELGDWRDPINLSRTNFLRTEERHRFYENTGFDSKLTSFPPEAQKELLVSAGLYEIDDTETTEPTEDNFIITNQAHDRLMRFEFQLRIFIETKLSKTFGQEWHRSQIPGEMRARWKKKQEADYLHTKTKRPLIEYADFTDYVTILVQKNNWAMVFVNYFEHKDSVQESFRRLFPVRLCTMHARPISQADSLYLLVELMRLTKAIKIDA